MKILTIVGARPQFIKASVISRLVRKSKSIEEVLVHTGQHYDDNMSDIFFKEMNISKPKYNLDINKLPYAEMVGKMSVSISKIIKKELPGAVMVYGDTNSTLSGAIAGLRSKTPLIHIESGLRSFNREMPEEINRILTDHTSDLLFCPNKNAKKNLNREGITKGIEITGDIMYDAFLFFKKKIKNNLEIKPYIIATVHRQENTDNLEKLTAIFSELDKINKKIPVIIPLHPRTLNIMNENKISTNVSIIKPLGYLDFLSYLINCNCVITDSGGLQKEAFFAKKKCITVRDQTEWTELVDLGVNILSSPNELDYSFNVMKTRVCDFSKKIYGNGKSGEIIIKRIKSFLNEK